MRTSLAAIALLLVTAIVVWPWQAHAEAPDLVALYHQHIQAINRGELAAIIADYTPDAVFIGPGAAPCSVAEPCAGKEAIQSLFRGLVAARLQAGIIDLQASGPTLTGRLNIVNDGIRAAGFGVVRIKVSVTFSGEKIARDVVEYDLSDPATAQYARLQRLSSLLRQHYAAINLGDTSAALAAFADDASYQGVGGCRDVPCTGKPAVQAEFERQIQNQARYPAPTFRGYLDGPGDVPQPEY